MESHTTDISILKQYLPLWKNLDDNQFAFERMASLSNVIWKVTALADNIKPKAVIYRQFAAESDFIDRSIENYIFDELSKANLGPICYGYSSDFRIEEFYDCLPVEHDDIRHSTVRRILAKNLAGLHSLHLPKLEKTPYFLKNLVDKVYISEVEKKLSATEFTEEEHEIISEIQRKLFSEEEIEFLLSILPKNSESITFSHNDLHAGNILRLKQCEEFLFIDLEYASCNYRGFDIANLFVESVFDYKVSEAPHYRVHEELYPPQSEIRDFIKYYAFFRLFRDDLSFEEADDIIKDEKLMNQYLKKAKKTAEVQQEIHEIAEEARIGKMLSHYHWTVWSVSFSKQKDTKFDYIAYAADRLRLYEKAKTEFLSKRSKKQI